MEYFLNNASKELKLFNGSYSSLSQKHGYTGDIYTEAYFATIYQLFSLGENSLSSSPEHAFENLKLIKKVNNAKHDMQYTLLHGGCLVVNNFAFDQNFNYARKFSDKVLAIIPDFERLLDDLNYQSLWRDSNTVMGAAILQIASSSFSDNLAGKLFFHLSRLTDESNGLWRSKKNPSLINSIAGAFHFLPIYDYCNEPIPCSSELKKGVLKLLDSRGILCGANGYACIDYDVVCILSYLWKHHRNQFSSREIKRIIGFLHIFIANMQNRSLPFSEYGEILDPIKSLRSILARFSRHRCLLTFAWDMKAFYRVAYGSQSVINANSIEANCGTPLSSNVFSILFRLMTIDVALELQQNLIDNSCEEKRKRMPLPGLGYL